MATPREQHGTRGGRARVVGSANRDGRQPLIEQPAAPDESARDAAEPARPAVTDPVPPG